MTALPMQMDEQDIIREHLAQEARVITESPRINLAAFVQNAFDSALLEAVGLKTERDANAYITRLLEDRAGRTLNKSEQVKVGIAVATEWNTRRAAQ